MSERESDSTAAALSRMRISTRVPAGPPSSIGVKCRYFASGYCANGSSCRFLHVDEQKPSGAAEPSFARPAAADFVVRPGVVNAPLSGSWEQPPVPRSPVVSDGYVDFSTAYASVFGPQSNDARDASRNVTERSPSSLPFSDDGDDDDDDALLRAAAAPSDADLAFVTSIGEIRASTYVSAAQRGRGTREDEARSAAHGHLDAAPPQPRFWREPAADGLKAMLCKFHTDGDCRYGERCRYTHGIACEICGKNALHPHDEELSAHHRRVCASDQERRRRVEESASVECGVCFESPVAIGRKFGLLQYCDHAFCLECIREWRGTDSAGTFGREAIRMCPLCRTESYLVIPSDTYENSMEAKEALMESYKKRLSNIPCRYYDFGAGECPFLGSCLYAHIDSDGNRVAPPERPQLLVSDTGVRVKTSMTLLDYLPG